MDMFDNKTAIVTGGASGIGRALSENLARRGAAVVMADRNAGLLGEVTRSIADAGYKAKAAEVDVTDFAAIKKLVADTVTEYGRLDYIFNNAGVTVAADAQYYDVDDWREVIDINLYGVVNGVAAAYPIMARQGFGQIVNTASLAGLVPAPGEVPYSTSKYGVVGLSNALRIEGATHGVKVNVVCPGFIKTSIYENMRVIELDREKMVAALPRMMSAEHCSQVILHGVERNKAIIMVTRGATIMWVLQRISPGLVRWMMSRMARRLSQAGRIQD